MKTAIMGKKNSVFLLWIAMPLFATTQNSILPSAAIHSTDSATSAASVQYQSHSFFRKMLMGSNYRKAWNQPLTLPLFHLSTSGFTIQQLGGGAQTKSLHLLDHFGKIWSLRTVDKDVSGAMPSFLRGSLAEKASQDLISAAFPYASVLAGELAYAAGIKAARPQVFYVADDTAFGQVAEYFVNRLCSLEERDPGFDSTCTTQTVAAKLKESSSYKIQQKLLLKARLFDMLIGDWDRHEDNWRWGQKDSAGTIVFYAIPRDRDWAFYQSSGWLPTLARWTKVMRHLVPFTATPTAFKKLNWKAAAFDRSFLNELSALDWEAATTELQTVLTDSSIRSALKKLPTSIYALYGEELFQKLKSRRDKLLKEVMKYYRFLSEEIIVCGSNNAEHFLLSSTSDDSVHLTVTNSVTNQQLYQRLISSKETFSISLHGFGDSDTFEITGSLPSTIRVVIDGGQGTDTYNFNGRGKIKISDAAVDNNRIINKGNAKFHFQ